MLIATTDKIKGADIKETLGIAKGNTIRARWIGRDIAAGLKTLVGGEIGSYTSMMTKARDEAMQRMIEAAGKLGADAVVGVRFTTSQVMSGASEILCYGTAVKLEK